MNMRKAVSLLLIACLAIACCSCAAKEEDLTPAEISEAAMANFVRKLEKGNYVVSGGQDVTVNVYSPEQVCIVYGRGLHATTYVFMTLKGETFAAEIDGTVMGSARFLSSGNAIDAVEEVLPNGWLTLTEGNLFELFYNDVEKPLEFTSNDSDVKKTLAGLGGYSELALSRMEEVRMVLDAKDPSSVRFTAVVADDESGRHYYDDLDLTLTFGAAKENSHVRKWLKDPVYPQERTEWTKDDLAILGNVFMRDYAEKALPFPAVSSYAMIFDDHAYDAYRGIRLTDSHWTEQDVEDYKALLKEKGFEQVNDIVFRRLLREEYGAYAKLDVSYDDGLLIVGTMDYESPAYGDREAVSGAVQEHGFAPLPETDVFEKWETWNTAGPQSESWAYFFDYDLYMTFGLRFTDREAAKAYLSAYADSLLEMGFFDRFIPGEDNRRCASANDYVSFQYTFLEDDDSVWLEFKNQKSLTVEETLALIREHGIPEPDIHGDIASRDVARYRYEIGGFEGLFLFIYQPFGNSEEAERYLDAYVPVLEENGYYQFDPQKVGSQRQFLYFNEELRKYVAFDFLPEEGGATVFFEIASFEAEPESLMLGMIRH